MIPGYVNPVSTLLILVQFTKYIGFWSQIFKDYSMSLRESGII